MRLRPPPRWLRTAVAAPFWIIGLAAFVFGALCIMVSETIEGDEDQEQEILW